MCPCGEKADTAGLEPAARAWEFESLQGHQSGDGVAVASEVWNFVALVRSQVP